MLVAYFVTTLYGLCLCVPLLMVLCLWFIFVVSFCAPLFVWFIFVVSCCCPSFG